MKKTLALLLALLMLLSLCACGSASSTESTTANYAASDTAAASENAEAGGLGMYGTSADSAADSGSGSSDVPEEDPSKIIYSSDVTIETTTFDDTLAALEALVKEHDGWVESSSVNGSDYYSQSRGYDSRRSASYTLRIPSAKFQTVMDSFSTLGNVPYSHTYTENISSQYYDVQARLNAYTTQEARLLELIEKAESVEDIITIETRLTELQYQIDSLQSTLKNWDRSVSYSTVSVEIDEVQEYTPGSEKSISYAQELWLALVDSLKGVGSFFKNLLVFLVSALPTLVILAVLFVIFRPLFKKLRAKRKARKAAKSAPSAPPESKDSK